MTNLRGDARPGEGGRAALAILAALVLLSEGAVRAVEPLFWRGGTEDQTVLPLVAAAAHVEAPQVAFMGTSQMGVAVVPKSFQALAGRPAANLGGPYITPERSYLLLKNFLLKDGKAPPTIVLGFGYWEFNESLPQQRDRRTPAFLWSLEDFVASLREGRRDTAAREERSTFLRTRWVRLSRLIWYGPMLKEVIFERLIPKSLRNMTPQEMVEEAQGLRAAEVDETTAARFRASGDPILEAFTSSRHQADALNDVLRLLRERHAPVVLVYMPLHPDLERWAQERGIPDEVLPEVERTAMRWGVPVIGPQRIPGGWTSADFYDGVHLNLRGRTKFTRWIAQDPLPRRLIREAEAAARTAVVS